MLWISASQSEAPHFDIKEKFKAFRFITAKVSLSFHQLFG